MNLSAPWFPPTVRITYQRPDPLIAAFVSGYHFFEIQAGSDGVVADIAYPGWSIIRFTIGGGAWQARSVGGDFADVPPAALFGTSSRATAFRTGGGLMVGAGVTPLGWARMFGASADAFADRITDLADLIGTEAEKLRQALRARTDDAGWTAILDDFFHRRVAALPPPEADIAALHQMLVDPAGYSVETIAARLGITPRHVGRLCLRAFGLSPKLLLRRARFLRALMPLRDSDPRPLPARIGTEYTDYAHFARDCRAFLGMSPSAFMALSRPISDASIAERTAKLGAAAQALHRP